MGTRSEIIADIQEAFNTDLADAIFELTVTNYDNGTYDTTTGETAGTTSQQTTSRGAYIGRWKYEVFNTPIEPDDEMLLILQDELSIVPIIGTVIESSQGISRVVEIRKDPMNVTYELRIRY